MVGNAYFLPMILSVQNDKLFYSDESFHKIFDRASAIDTTEERNDKIKNANTNGMLFAE